MGSDSRIGKRFLFPGVGFGGSCFPKDVKALEFTAAKEGYEFSILKSVLKVNDRQRVVLVKKIKTFFGQNLKGKKIAIWGLSFKPNTDDIREAAALYIINELLLEGCEISVFDPEAMENVKTIYGKQLSYGNNPEDVLKDVEALCIITEWAVFRTPDFKKMKQLMKAPNIFDGRNLYSIDQMEKEGFFYESIGRKIVEI
jgi:UDPglucose 6-dehydrogenase